MAANEIDQAVCTYAITRLDTDSDGAVPNSSVNQPQFPTRVSGSADGFGSPSARASRVSLSMTVTSAR